MSILITIWVIGGIIATCIALGQLWRYKHPNPCDSCKHLLRKGGGYLFKYSCTKASQFDRQPKYCARYEPRDELRDK